jgi:hypothetical protein
MLLFPIGHTATLKNYTKKNKRKLAPQWEKFKFQKPKEKLKLFPCKHCSMKFATALNLGAHMRSHDNHKEEEEPKVEMPRATPEQQKEQRKKAANAPRNRVSKSTWPHLISEYEDYGEKKFSQLYPFVKNPRQTISRWRKILQQKK